MVDINLHVTLHPSDQTPPWAKQLMEMVGVVISKENRIMSALTDALDQAEAAAKANSDADDAAESLLLRIIQLYTDAAAGADPTVLARVTALSTALSTRAAQLSAAVVAGTPADPATPSA